MSAKPFPLLRQGEHVKLAAAGPTYTVKRVTPCAAYLKGGEIREVTITNADGSERSFEAEATRIIAVSPHACVIREGASS